MWKTIITRNTGTQETRGDEDYKLKPKQNHCYGHTPQIQKGAKTSNSGVERMPKNISESEIKHGKAVRRHTRNRSFMWLQWSRPIREHYRSNLKAKPVFSLSSCLFSCMYCIPRPVITEYAYNEGNLWVPNAPVLYNH